MVEGARLESVFRGNSNVGSNPTLSAIIKSVNYRNKPVSACNSVQRCVAIRSKSSLTQARRVRGWASLSVNGDISRRSKRKASGWANSIRAKAECAGFRT